MFYLEREVEKVGDVFADRKVTLPWLMNSYMDKPEKFDQLHSVYHFTVPLKQLQKKTFEPTKENLSIQENL